MLTRIDRKMILTSVLFFAYVFFSVVLFHFKLYGLCFFSFIISIYLIIRKYIVAYIKKHITISIMGLLLTVNYFASTVGSVFPAINKIDYVVFPNSDSYKTSLFADSMIRAVDIAILFAIPALIFLFPLSYLVDRFLNRNFIGYRFDNDGRRIDMLTGSANISLRYESVSKIIDSFDESSANRLGSEIGEDFSKSLTRVKQNDISHFIELWENVDRRAGLFISIIKDEQYIKLKSDLLDGTNIKFCHFFLGYLQGVFRNCPTRVIGRTVSINWDEQNCDSCRANLAQNAECLAKYSEL